MRVRVRLRLRNRIQSDLDDISRRAAVNAHLPSAPTSSNPSYSLFSFLYSRFSIIFLSQLLIESRSLVSSHFSLGSQFTLFRGFASHPRLGSIVQYRHRFPRAYHSCTGSIQNFIVRSIDQLLHPSIKQRIPASVNSHSRSLLIQPLGDGSISIQVDLHRHTCQNRQQRLTPRLLLRLKASYSTFPSLFPG